MANIDWPSQPGLPRRARSAPRPLALLDRAAAIGLNALVLQVRPAGDALYPSALEPWSEYLTGAQGRAPGAGLGPAGLVGAARRTAAASSCTPGSTPTARATRRRSRRWRRRTWRVRQPALVRRYGDQLWLDPGEPAAAAHTLAVVADVVRRYDIDGVHIDDYFYPYPVKAGRRRAALPRRRVLRALPAGGGTLARDDWRRANVDALVQELHAAVQRIKPWVRFGISPFGLGRPDRRPPGISGFSQYDKLYADVERWLENGWLDYLAPQLYWPIDRAGQAFPVLLDYWMAQNRAAPPRLAGAVHEPGRARRAAGPRALAGARDRRPGGAAAQRAPAAGGHIHFSMVALMQDRDGIATLLQQAPMPAGAGAGHALAGRPAAAARRVLRLAGRARRHRARAPARPPRAGRCGGASAAPGASPCCRRRSARSRSTAPTPWS